MSNLMQFYSRLSFHFILNCSSLGLFVSIRVNLHFTRVLNQFYAVSSSFLKVCPNTQRQLRGSNTRRLQDTILPRPSFVSGTYLMLVNHDDKVL